MTQHLIYGKLVEIQADQNNIKSPTTITGGLTTDTLVAPVIGATSINTQDLNVFNNSIIKNLDISSSLSFPILAPSSQARLDIVDSGGAGIIGNPATGAPFVIPASSLAFRFYMGLAQTSGNTSFYQGSIATGGGVPVTVTITAPGVGSSLLIPGWIPNGFRPLIQQRVPVFAAVGPVAQPTTLIFQMETNGDVRIFKDSISTNWNNNDTFTINAISPFMITCPFPLP